MRIGPVSYTHLKYNKEPFHILHGLTVEGVMEWYAEQLGYGDEKAFWGMAGQMCIRDSPGYDADYVYTGRCGSA